MPDDDKRTDEQRRSFNSSSSQQPRQQRGEQPASLLYPVGPEKEPLSEENQQQKQQETRSATVHNTTDPYLRQMLLMTKMSQQQHQLSRSARHQKRFLSQRSKIKDAFPNTALYSPVPGQFAAVVLNNEWAYLHIWKSGGTTIEAQTGRGPKPFTAREIQQRKKWMTFVRSPIDHFLSGWSEWGFRIYDKAQKRKDHDTIKRLRIESDDYDTRIRTYLHLTETMANQTKAIVGQSRKIMDYPQRFTATRHSFPQANFLLDNKSDQKVFENLKLVGDLNEMAPLLKLVGFQYNITRGKGRVAVENEIKQKYFPVRKDLISNATMLKICNFVAIDYFLFDFEPPEVCTFLLDRPFTIQQELNGHEND